MRHPILPANHHRQHPGGQGRLWGRGMAGCRVWVGAVLGGGHPCHRAGPCVGLVVCGVGIAAGGAGFCPVVPRMLAPNRVGWLLSPGVGLFATELFGGVVLAVFNNIARALAGTLGVAAYGVVANLALVVLAIFGGVAQGLQPLFSTAYAAGHTNRLAGIYTRWRAVALCLGAAVAALGVVFAPWLAGTFGGQGGSMLPMATNGVRLYFLGFAFAGYNLLTVSLFGCTNRHGSALVTSLLWGVVGPLVLAAPAQRVTIGLSLHDRRG